MKKLSRSFYNRSTLDVARDLLGKIIVHRVDGKEISGRIVETEGYIGAIDKACHCYKKITKRTEVMFGQPGHAYVYLIYGMYCCMNIVTESEGVGAAVLIRALEPLKGIEEMAVNRYKKTLNELNKRQLNNLTNGPGKLCMALNITREENKEDLTGEGLFLLDDGFDSFEIAKGKRINIDYAQEAKDFEWRFYIKGNKYVSK